MESLASALEYLFWFFVLLYFGLLLQRIDQINDNLRFLKEYIEDN